MKRFAILFFAIALSAILFAQPKKFTREMTMNYISVSSPVISADGNWTAYSKIIQPDADEGKKSSHRELWVRNLKSGKTTLFATKEEPAGSYVFSDDNQWLYFRATRSKYNEKAQVYRMPLNGGFPERVTDHPAGVSSFALSADGDKVAFIAKEEVSEEKKKATDNGEDWIIDENNFTFQHLYVFDSMSKTSVRVSPENMHVFSFVWEPDGKHLIYQAAEKGLTDYNYMFRDLFRTAADKEKVSKLCDHDGKLGKMSVSPDGKYLAFLGAVDISDPSPQSILLTEIGSGKWRNLTAGQEASFESVAWTSNSKLVSHAAVFNHTEIFEIGIKGNVQQLIGKGPIYGAPSLADDGDHFVLTASEYNHPNELYSGSLKSATVKRLTNSNPQFEKIKFFPLEDYTWTARDGKDISGVVVKPGNFSANGHAPLIVFVHGGPEGARFTGWNNAYSRWPQLMAQKGYVVFIPNYRGSVGRGVEFSKADHNDMMGVDFNDVLDGIDALINQKWVDGRRVGITGGSYGGYMTAWAATKYSDRFAAGVMFVGISNQISKMGVTDTPEENSLVHWNSYNWDDNFKLAWDRSPLKYIENHRTPLLIAHGDSDKRVPTGQSHELFRALKHKNTAPVKLIIYPGEGHGNRMRAHREHYMNNAIDWLDGYLLKDKPSF